MDDKVKDLVIHINRRFHNKTSFEKAALLEKRIRKIPVKKPVEKPKRPFEKPEKPVEKPEKPFKKPERPVSVGHQLQLRKVKLIHKQIKMMWKMMRGRKKNSSEMKDLLYKTTLCNSFIEKVLK